MFFIALPATIASFMLIGLTIHSGGFVQKILIVLVPGFWVLDLFGETAKGLSSEIFFTLIIVIQIIFWSILLILADRIKCFGK